MPRSSTQGSVLACALGTKKSWQLFFTEVKMFTIVVELGRVRFIYSCDILDDRQLRV